MWDEMNNEITLNDLLKFKGNEEEFKILNDNLEKPFDFELIYTDINKTKLKYKGKLADGKYEGRGILYDDYIYDGYFIEGKKQGYFRVYKNNPEKTLIYQGFYKNNQYYSRGILYNELGEKIYDGFFFEGKYRGIGIEYFQNGKFKRVLPFNDGEPLKECMGVLYNEDNIIYQGLIKNLKPEKGKNIYIYGNKRNIIYHGDLKDFEYDGKGTLYYSNKKEKYFEGNLNKGSYVQGALYSPDGNKIYEGEFINNKPKEYKDIKLYELNGNLLFIGDLAEGKYQGNGKLYENSHLLYEGNFANGYYEGYGTLYLDEITKYEGMFKEGKYNGNGKLFKEKYLYYEGTFSDGIIHGMGIIYYPNGQKYFEGFFEIGKIKGEGIKYYDNGSKKIEANFSDKNTCKGKYYSPDNELLYEGPMLDDIPSNNKKIRIYSDYTYKIYKAEIKDDIYSISNIEYAPNFCMSDIFKEECTFNITFVSFIPYSGKTTIIKRIISGKFSEDTMSTLGMEYFEYFIEKNNKKFKVSLFDMNGEELNRETCKIFCKNKNFIIYTINLYDEVAIDEYYIDEIKSKLAKESIIYLIGNKHVNQANINNVELNRNKVKELIENHKINKYFEVNAKTGEGFDFLKKNINFDVFMISKKS